MAGFSFAHCSTRLTPQSQREQSSSADRREHVMASGRRRLFRGCLLAGIASALCMSFAAQIGAQSGARPVYTPDGTMMQLPAGFETWVFVGSNLGLAYKSEMTENDAREANRAAEQQFF